MTVRDMSKERLEKIKEEEERLKEEERLENIKREEERRKVEKEEEQRRIEEETKERLAQLEKELYEKQREKEELKHTDFAKYISMEIDNIFSDDDDLLVELETTAILSNNILYIECELPTKEEVSNVKEIYYTQDGDEREKLYNAREFAKFYDNKLYLICLKSIALAYSLDEEKKIGSVIFNGFISDYNPTNGKFERNPILSIITSREQFDEIDIEHVEPKTCFKALKGVSASNLIDCVPITPILSFNKDDKRFIEGRDIETDSGTNLAAMDWQDFEQLVREVLQLRFEKDGWKVNITRASRDGGVDAVIFNPDPLTGGKILVQAKRYTNTVGVSAVRDLYGAMTDERASKGILITTADFGSDSYNFVKDKPISLLNGGHLLGMMQELGMKGYIDIQEAKQIETYR